MFLETASFSSLQASSAIRRIIDSDAPYITN